MEIGYAGAFLGGVLTLLSPCSALLLPAFFAYAFSTRTSLVARTALFYAGLGSTLLPLGIFAGAMGSLVTVHRNLLVTGAAALVILLGVLQILGIRMPALLRNTTQAGSSRLSVFVLGAVYGVAGVCTGPILGSVLTVAAVGSSAVYGAVLLAIYALGMALPLFVLALFWDRMGITRRRWLRPRPVSIGRWSNSWIMVISGILSVAIGILLLLTDGTAGLGGVLSVGDQFRLESSVSAGAAGMSNTVFALIALAVLAAAAVLFLKNQRNTNQSRTPGPVPDRVRPSDKDS
ncbi:cytochrome c biogenesis CcdA family protein [Arthrobacter crystallopoietes]|uniref:Cytochrome c biogenesis protein CcdA n=1 Tax=Crystallibacter crystallopoietes TaxID=37928 RepID=A0A1H1HYK7_9MICC|nr:cytochrome c biogenesis CcdA family protein [Arthrobacter crystallopoietes]AUI53696.1 cytochrome C biogenesis protein CcdA [Arthrobacter crystallopoietes]SDR30545.1 Cytochrome c biogenesis protein CcdA [Arthrobacter crystallopoietes]